MTAIDDIIDLDRYPIGDLKAPEARALVERGRVPLAAEGCFVLDGFVRSEAIAGMVAEAEARLPRSFYNDRLRDSKVERRSLCFAWKRDIRVAMTSVAGDRIGADTILRRLYQWDPLTDVIGALLDRKSY